MQQTGTLCSMGLRPKTTLGRRIRESKVIDILLNGAVFVGFLLGLAAASVFHWLAPVGTDTAAAGAWLVGLGCLAGALWSLARGKHGK
jgi:hypothetical protein